MNIEPLVGVLAERFGLVHRPDWPEKIMAALSAAADEQGLCPDDVAYRAESDVSLLRQIASVLVVEETHFLRDAAALDFVAARLAGLAAQRGLDRKVMVWSAGCSTGEEPYTMSMLLEDHLPAHAADAVTIVATDLNAAAIAAAEQGVYGGWSFRSVPAAWLERFFDRRGERLQVRPLVRERVRLCHMSLQEQILSLPDGSFDAVLFRNVAIYLDEASNRQLYSGFGRVLRPGGLLAVAPADPRPDSALFEPIEHRTTCLYGRKPDSRAPASHPQQPVGRVRPERSLARPRQASVQPGFPARHRAEVPSIARIRELGNSGRLDEAIAGADLLVANSSAGEGAHVVRGQLHLSALNLEAAVADLRRAIEMAPDNRLARYWYALALRQSGQLGELLAQLRWLDLRLAAHAPQAVLEDGRTTAGELLRAVRSIQEAVR